MIWYAVKVDADGRGASSGHGKEIVRPGLQVDIGTGHSAFRDNCRRLAAVYAQAHLGEVGVYFYFSTEAARGVELRGPARPIGVGKLHKRLGGNGLPCRANRCFWAGGRG